ncbi:hypothetical protein ACN27F_11160 [Solwaraspora sp. WMMB335]|uniref:hypothetical protein n=1 Tax=Solwaraspora sp. WMMB335 TaxID=3404118 RepID=UPI003B92A322
MTGAGIWGLLIVCCCVLLALLALAAIADRPAGDRPDHRQLRTDADELTAEAATIAAAAAAARGTAAAARHRAIAAEQARDDAWRRQEDAGLAYQQALHAARRRPVAASADGAVPPTTRVVPAAGTALDRDLSRAAFTAYRRGDISVDQLRQVWQRSGDPDSGSDPGRRDLDRAADQLRMRDRAARREYDAAAALARRAADAARIAEVAAAALIDEAAAAALDAEEARYAADHAAGGRRRR